MKKNEKQLHMSLRCRDITAEELEMQANEETAISPIKTQLSDFKKSHLMLSDGGVESDHSTVERQTNAERHPLLPMLNPIE